MKTADYLPALGFGLGALAAWYWQLGPLAISFCVVACVGWVLIGREMGEE